MDSLRNDLEVSQFKKKNVNKQIDRKGKGTKLRLHETLWFGCARNATKTQLWRTKNVDLDLELSIPNYLNEKAR